MDQVNSTTNLTNRTLTADTTGYVVFNLIFIVVLLIPVVIVNLLIILFLCRDKGTARQLRFMLANILGGCVVVAVGLLMYHTTGTYLALSGHSPPSHALCRTILAVIAMGGALRLLFMMAFSVTVFQVVKYPMATTLRMYALCLVGSFVLWGLAILGALPMASESVVLADFAEGISCGPTPVGPISIAYVALYAVLFGGFCSFATITFLAITVRYICKKTLTDREIMKGLVKLGFFLLVGNTIALFGQIVPPLVATFIVTEEEFATMNYNYLVELVYTAYTLINASLLPPVVLVLVYFEPLRRALLSCLRKAYRRTQVFTLSRHSADTGHLQLSAISKEVDDAL
jgi:hypothetical protein